MRLLAEVAVTALPHWRRDVLLAVLAWAAMVVDLWLVPAVTS